MFISPGVDARVQYKSFARLLCEPVVGMLMAYHCRVEILEHVRLAPYTTLRIGGEARYFVEVDSEATLVEALRFAREAGLRVFVLGGGSNVVVADEGFAGLVLRVALPARIERVEDGEVVDLDVSAGTGWDELVRYACEQGLCGMECLAGIPGLVGGSPIQNIGAYGQEVSQTIERVAAYDMELGEMVELGNEACGFAYRTSIFNSTLAKRYVVMGVRFRLAKGGRPNLSYADLAPLRGLDVGPLEVYEFVRKVREGKGMLILESLGGDSRSVGSFFRNPVVEAGVLGRIAEVIGVDVVPHWAAGGDRVKLSAAWLIAQAGFAKGYRLGEAGLSTRHTLALTNAGGMARCGELLALRDLIAGTVQERFGVELMQEPVLVGS